MKIPTLLTRKKKLNASTARRSRSLGLPDEMDYEEMSEPNMKLSRALLIVLVLHIVAVAGIVAFNTIKTRETNNATDAPATASSPAAIEPDLAPAAATTTTAATAPIATAPSAGASAVSADRGNALRTAHTTVRATDAPNEPAVAATKSTVKDSGKLYTVLKGDNPVTIARHLKVSEADLLELNQITDPRKLQINQKLKIPEAHAPAKAKSN